MVRQLDGRSSRSDCRAAFGERHNRHRLSDLAENNSAGKAATLTDRTLSCLDDFCTSENAACLNRLHDLLCSLRPDWLELSPKALRLLNHLEPTARYTLRIASPEEMDFYPDFCRFVVPAEPRFDFADERFVVEFCIDTLSASALCLLEGVAHPRVVGVPRFLVDFPQDAAFPPNLCLSPENDVGLATANAVAFLECGGAHVASSVGGLGNLACTEELLLFLQLWGQDDENADYTVLPAIRDVLEELCNFRFAPDKPVMGRRIFAVESGVHVDGLLKDSRLYEPFAPQLVGQSRHIVIGKHSGKTSILAVLAEEGFCAADFDVEELLETSKKESQRLGRALTRIEFINLACAHRRDQVL